MQGGKAYLGASALVYLAISEFLDGLAAGEVGITVHLAVPTQT
jgi:hypothetical protein